MKLLVLGHSRIVERRVLPALAQVLAVERVDVASRWPRAAVPGLGGSGAAPQPVERPPGDRFSSYDTALERSTAELAWVSVVNSAHAELVERCLRRGLHVVVEKPAATRLVDVERLLEVARSQDRCLAEATVFCCHPQIALVREAFARRDDRPSRLAAVFSVPPFVESDFRYRRELGGGALYDLGPYAVAASRLFFGVPAREVSCRVLTRGPGGIDTAFSILSTFGDGRAMTGHFGFDTEYCNRLELLGRRVSVSLDRVFSTPPDTANEIEVRASDRHQRFEAPAADSFALFAAAVIASIGEGTHRRWGEILLTDAVALHALRAAAGEAEA